MAEIERDLLGKQRRVFIPRIRHGDTVVDTTPETRLQKGDTIALAGRRAFLMPAETEIGAEVDDPQLLISPSRRSRWW